MVEVAKAMGLTITKPVRAKEEMLNSEARHKFATLVLPLVKHRAKSDKKFRKRE